MKKAAERRGAACPRGVQAHTRRYSVGMLQRGHKSPVEQVSEEVAAKLPVVLRLKGPRNSRRSGVCSPCQERQS